MTRLSPKTQAYLSIAVYILGIAVLAVLFWQTLDFVRISYVDQRKGLGVLMTPLFIPQTAIPAGLFFLLLQFIANYIETIERLRKRIPGRLPTEKRES